MKKIAIYLIMILFLGISCSEDVKVNPELAGPLYGLTKGEPGSVDELIYNTWEEWGMYYLYKFEPYAFQVTNWSGYFNNLLVHIFNIHQCEKCSNNSYHSS